MSRKRSMDDAREIVAIDELAAECARQTEALIKFARIMALRRQALTARGVLLKFHKPRKP